MANGDKRNPPERSSTDEGLRTERRKTDAELASRSAAMHAVATNVINEARDKADSVLSDARDLEDSKHGADRAVRYERAQEDAELASERSGADAVARDEIEQRRVALASLLAFERQYTDLKLETERIHADQVLTSREDFMAMVSHDLRSLLGGIALSAEMLKQLGRVGDPERVTSYAERIQRYAALMTRLVADLMDVASIEAGKLGLVRVRRNLAQLIRDSTDAFEPAAAFAGIKLRCVAADPGFAEIDHERILQVLTNLVGNAIKFTPNGGQITIRIDRRDAEVRFAVSDTGKGIDCESLERIFERYFQSDNEGARRGLGLGLFISKSIVEGHGGRIWAESALGQGCTVYFTVPSVN